MCVGVRARARRDPKRRGSGKAALPSLKRQSATAPWWVLHSFVRSFIHSFIRPVTELLCKALLELVKR